MSTVGGVTAFGRPRWVAASVALLFAATLAFVLGVSLERNAVGTESPTTSIQTSGGTIGESGGEAQENKEKAGGPADSPAGVEGSERVLGVDLESLPAVIVMVGLSVLLAAAAWWRPARAVLIIAVLFCTGALLLDLVEVSRQISQNSPGIAAVAVLVALLHAMAGASAGMAAAAPHGARPSPAGAQPL